MDNKKTLKKINNDFVFYTFNPNLNKLNSDLKKKINNIQSNSQQDIEKNLLKTAQDILTKFKYDFKEAANLSCSNLKENIDIRLDFMEIIKAIDELLLKIEPDFTEGVWRVDFYFAQKLYKIECDFVNKLKLVSSDLIDKTNSYFSDFAETTIIADDALIKHNNITSKISFDFVEELKKISSDFVEELKKISSDFVEDFGTYFTEELTRISVYFVNFTKKLGKINSDLVEAINILFTERLERASSKYIEKISSDFVEELEWVNSSLRRKIIAILLKEIVHNYVNSDFPRNK